MERTATATKRRFWVVLHHQIAAVVESSERPPTTVDKGERQKKIRGPYATRDQAQRVAEAYLSNTLKAQAAR